MTNRRGYTTTYQYNQNHLTEEEINAASYRISKRYDSKNNLVSVTNQRGYTTAYTYDQNNNITSIADPAGTIYFTYNDFNKISSMTDKRGYTTSYGYDDRDNLTSITYQDGSVRTFSYNELGLLTFETDQRGNQTHYTYDEFGNLKETDYPDGSKEEYQYDQVGRLIKLTRPDCGVIIYSYDDNDNIFKVVDQLGNEVTFQYNSRNKVVEKTNPNGNITAMTNRNGNTYQYHYDALDRLVKEINYQGYEQGYSYDPNSNLVEKYDFNGNTTSYNYDELNRLLQVIFADGSSKDFRYNSNGLMTSAVNENSSQCYYYDELSRLIKAEIDNNGKEYTVNYEYNQVGQQTKVILDDGNILNERETSYQYDELMRLSQVELSDGEVVKYRYDELNRVINQLNSNNTGTTYTYTPDGRVKTITHYKGFNGPGQVLQSYGYIYNARNERILQVEGSGQLQAYEYDPVGRLTKVYYLFPGQKKESDLKERLYYGLNPGGNGKGNKKYNAAQPLSVDLNLPYEIRNRVEELHRNIRQDGGWLDFYGEGFYTEEFSYDPAGNVTQKINGWGNVDYQYNPANQLLQAGNRSYEYDLNGNLVKEELNGDYAEYSYNYENRLIKAANLSKNQHLFGGSKPFGGEVAYAYDALGRKVNKTVNPVQGGQTEVTGYLYNGARVNVLAEYELSMHGNNGNVKGNRNGKVKIDYLNEYYYGHGLVALNYLNNPDRGRVHPNISLYHKDVLGSISMITGKNGQVIDRYKYDAYGSPYNGRFEQGNNMNPYGFTGQRYEVEINVYSFAYRTYNPRSMRWLTVDPIRDRINWYVYVNSDPVNLWDPLGLHWVGGLNIEYPEDYNPNNYSEDSTYDKLMEELNIVTTNDVNDAFDFMKEQIQFGLKAQLVKDYGTSKGLLEIYNEIDKNIPPDVSFGPSIDYTKSLVDATFSIMPDSENEITVEQYYDLVFKDNNEKEE